jgi:hypothetical protein
MEPSGMPQTAKARPSKAFDLTIEDDEDSSNPMSTPSQRQISERKQHFENEYQKKRDPMAEFFQLVSSSINPFS